MLCGKDSEAGSIGYPDVTIRDFGKRGNPADRLQPIEAHKLKAESWILDPKTGHPCTVTEQPKKSKTGKHGHAKISCKLKMAYSAETSSLMASGHQQLDGCVIEKPEYVYSFIEGDKDTDHAKSVTLVCLDDKNFEKKLKLSRTRADVWKKVIGAIEAGEEAGDEIRLVVLECPKRNKDANQGYDILQLIIDAKTVKAE